MRLRIGTVRLRAGNARLSAGSSGDAGAPASTFTVTLSAFTGAVGTIQTATVTPIGGAWPAASQAVTLSTSGVACAVTQDSRTGSGTTPVTFSFTPSAAGTLSINATATGMTSTGGQSYTATAAITPSATPTSKASRYDVIMDQSAVAPGTAATGKLYPNGLWSGGSATVGGVTVTLPSSGNSPVAFSKPTSAAGELSLTAINTAGLRNPAPALASVFAAVSGTASTVTIGTLPYNFRTQRTFQQCVWSGAPAGFSGSNGATLNNGWGRVKVPVTATVQGLFARLTDAYSSGATATGGGTIITNVAQVYGPVSGSQNVALILPASDYCVYLDLASDAAFTKPVRMPLKFFIRDVIMIVTRSQENMLFGTYAPGVPGNTNWSSYTKTTGIGGQNPNGAVDAVGAWIRCDGVQSYGNYGQGFGSVGAQELGRLFVAKKGTGVGIAGLVPAGGDMDAFWAADGSPSGAIVGLMDECDGEARYLAFESNGWSAFYAPESVAMYRQVYQAIPGKMMALYPSLAVVSGNSASGYFGGDGSKAAGYTRQNSMIRELELTDQSVTSAEAGADWNEYYSNSYHAAWSSAIRYSRARARSLLLTEVAVAGGYGRPYSDRYTTLGTSGSLSSGVISIPYTLAAGATKVVAWRWQNGLSTASAWTYTTPSAADLRRLVTVYQGANGRQDNGAAMVTVTGVTIDIVNRVLNITVPTGTTGPLTVQFLADFNAKRTIPDDSSFWCGFFDDRDLGDGCGYGPGMRSQLDIVVS